ncbi:MAG: CpsB/CapC family capsule biosynthesis tyrosine phosphatase [Velocimicrobium sp.]
MKDNGFYDVHIHLLPGVDDGASSMDITRQMLQRAYDQGVRVLIATPHYISATTTMTKDTRLEILEEVRKEAISIAPDLRVEMGNELYYSESILADLLEGKAATMCDSDYVLVEFATNVAYKELYRGMRRFVEAGYRPILAHVERYDCLWKEYAKLKELISLGAYIQMNAESLMGGFLDGRAAYCRKLILLGYVHLIGSDAHGIENRPPLMLDAVKMLIKKRIPEDELEKIFFYNPERMIQNKYI